MKSALAREIFRQDLLQIYEQQTLKRDELRRDAREILAKIVASGTNNPVVDTLLRRLAKKLAVHKGKKVYGYLPADAKAMVDRIVDELSGDPHIAKLYDLWYEQRENVLKTYHSELPKRMPLSQNAEFKTIKNAVIAEAGKLVLEPKVVDAQGFAQPRSDNGYVAMGSLNLLGQLARIIENEIAQEHSPEQVDGKLREEIRVKKREQGLK